MAENLFQKNVTPAWVAEERTVEYVLAERENGRLFFYLENNQQNGLYVIHAVVWAQRLAHFAWAKVRVLLNLNAPNVMEQEAYNIPSPGLSVVFHPFGRAGNKIKKLNRYAESPEIIGTSAIQHLLPINWGRL